VILTSGTTGRPRGVSRGSAGVDAALALVAGFPYKVRRTHLVAAPAFHAWGWMNLILTMVFSSTVVMTRRFEPAPVLELLEREQADAMVAVPVMLQRLVDVGDDVRARYDTSSLRVVAVSGSALSGALAERFMDSYGDVLYNLYGSTEAAFATVAAPADLRAAPGTAGRPLPGVTVSIVDPTGEPLPPGETGEIVVGSGTTFEGYTSGEHGKQADGGGVRIGDLGRFDAEGRLFVAGRADDLVITGGENVYPVTVENELERHPDVVECAVVGEPDDEFGQALVAHVVLRPGATADPDAIRGWLKQRLGPHEVPRRVVVHDDPLPRNTTGKVVKTELRQAQNAEG
jgi:fatty-acyl-CoA synthase